MMRFKPKASLCKAGAVALAAMLALLSPALAQSTLTPPPAAPQTGNTTTAPNNPGSTPTPTGTGPAATPPAPTPVAPVPSPAAPSPAAPAPAAPAAPQSPAATPPAPATPAPSTGAAPSSGAATPDNETGDSSISQTMDLPSRPAALISGKASWDDGFKSISDSFAKLNDVLAQNKVAGAGRPLAVFTATDDAGFSYTAMIPLDKAPEGKTDLGSGVTIGQTPSGKAMRFQHRGAYDDIDATYEAITAYLDQKGLEARNLFAEEYLNQVKTSDDSSLQVDIYVFLK